MCIEISQMREFVWVFNDHQAVKNILGKFVKISPICEHDVIVPSLAMTDDHSSINRRGLHGAGRNRCIVRQPIETELTLVAWV